MTRISKQEERRHKCPKKHKTPLFKKTGPQKDKLALGYKNKDNAIEMLSAFIPKIK
ncbi:MAG: hypothetical protein HZB76_03275 [Chlamydiae bacterium]|nr:hypothetical protein [Chlamydiota bacterium]